MNLVNIQIKNVDRAVKERLEKQVKEDGFSSIQEYFRYLINRLDKTNTKPELLIKTTFEDKLSVKMDKKYDRMIDEMNEDIKNGKLEGFTSVDDLMRDLKS